MSISVLEPSSSPSSYLVILFMHLAFSLSFFGCHIFFPKSSSFLCTPVVGMFSCHSLPLVDRMLFHCFGKSCFVCNCFTLCRYIFNPSSFASTFCFISSSCTVIFSCVACSFSPRLFQRLSFIIILACFS